MKNKFQIGCIADDFTGASDAASFLQKNGLRTMLFNGIPKDNQLYESDAVVIALKNRTTPVKEAVKEAIDALTWLKEQGASKLYIKYCSTFDSTREGNIGPIVDAALDLCETPYTLLCPSLPVNGRTVKDGKLAVNGVPLHETHMRNHPLTPMWDDRISELMHEQGKYPCMALSYEEMCEGKEKVMEKISAFAAGKEHFYVVPDYYEENHRDLIYEVFEELPLLTGGSGLLGAAGLGSKQQHRGKEQRSQVEKSCLFAGSCSKITLEQIEDYREKGHELIKIDPICLLEGEITEDSLWEQMQGKDNVLVYSADTAENVKKVQQLGKEKIAGLLEETMSNLAKRASENHYTQVIVAGGETSGAVTKKLGFDSYLIGKSVAPGVPIMIPVKNQNIRLVLKSGNFGQPDFFERAVRMTTLEEE